MQRLVQCVPAGGIAFDPFCGAGITLIAAALEGRQAVGFEDSEENCEIAARRLEDAQSGELLEFVNGSFILQYRIRRLSRTEPGLSGVRPSPDELCHRSSMIAFF